MADPKAPPHGTRKRYYHRADPCRCAACREANAAYMRQRRNGARRATVAGTVPIVNRRGKVVGHQAPLFD